MSNISVWIMAMIGPVVGRVLVSLGFSVVTITGVDAVITGIKDVMLQQMLAIPAAALQLALLSGVGTALGMIFGAITTRLVMWQLGNATRILGVSK